MGQGLRQLMDSGQLALIDEDEDGALAFEEFYKMQLAQRIRRGGGR